MNNSPNDFDTAAAATEAMFSQEQMSLDDASDASAAETAENGTEQSMPSDDIGANGNTELDMAARTAEIAAEAAADKDNQLQMALQELAAIKQQNEKVLLQNKQLQGTIEELSRKNEEKVLEEVLEVPDLDLDALAFADAETVKAAKAKYAADMAAYNRKLMKDELMREVSPALEYAREGMREKEKAQVLSVLSQIPELSGISEMVPALDRIIADNKWLSSDDMPMDEKYINAYAMAMGVKSINTPPPEPAKEPTADELMNYYNTNAAFRDMVEKQRISELKKNHGVPIFSASGGASGAAPYVEEKPKTFEEASERTRKMFGE